MTMQSLALEYNGVSLWAPWQMMSLDYASGPSLDDNLNTTLRERVTVGFVATVTDGTDRNEAKRRLVAPTTKYRVHSASGGQLPSLVRDGGVVMPLQLKEIAGTDSFRLELSIEYDTALESEANNPALVTV